MRRLFLLSVVILVLVLAACGGDDEQPPAPTATVPPAPVQTLAPTATPLAVPETDTDPLTRAQLRVVQASPDLPPVNLYLDAGNIGRGFLPGNYHSEPLSLSAGSYLLRVVPAGEDPDAAAPLLAGQIDLGPGESVIAVLAGTGDALQMIVAREDLSALTGNLARLSVIHAVPRGAAFNLQEINRTMIGQMDYGMIGGPVELPEGRHPLSFISGPQTLASVELALSPRYAYTLILFPGAEGGYDTLHVRSRVVDESRVRLVHASPDLPAVDLYLGNTRVAEALTFENATDWQAFPSLSYNLRVVPAAGDPADSLVQQQVALVPDQAMNLILFNTRDRLRINALPEDLSPLPEGSARVTFIHAAVSSSSLAVIPAGSQDFALAEIGFGEVTPPFDMAAGPAEYVFEDRGGATAREIDRLSTLDLAAGESYLIVVTGYPNSEPVVLSTDTTATATATSPNQTARYAVRLVNALADGTVVDLAIDGVPVFDAVAPGASTDYHVFESRPRHATLLASGTGVPVADEDLPVPDATRPMRYALFVYRVQGDARTLLVPDDEFLLGDGQARLRVLHAAPNRPTLVITRQEETSSSVDDEENQTADTGGEPAPTPTPPQEIFLSSPVSFGQINDPQVIPAGTYDMRVLELNTNTLAMTISDAVIESRTFYDLLLLPDPSGLGIAPLLVPRPE